MAGNRWIASLLMLGIAVLLIPQGLQAQSLQATEPQQVQSLQEVLNTLYVQMLPLCSRFIDTARALAGIATLCFISSRVWGHLSRAESVDFYPLFRPFAIGLCVLFFPALLAVLHGVLQPVLTASQSLLGDSDLAVAKMLERKQEALEKSDSWQIFMGHDGQGDRSRWYKYSQPEDVGPDHNEGFFEGLGNDIRFSMERAAYSFRHSVKEWMSEVLQLLFYGASLCINTLRTFQLIVLGILGPLVLALSVFEAFRHSLVVWLARYINIYLWLPVANIFGSIIARIQENMLRMDIGQIQQTGDTFFSATDLAYLVFLLIGIVGYFTVPSVANYIVHAGADAFSMRLSGFFSGMAVGRSTLVGQNQGMLSNQFGDRETRLSGDYANSTRQVDYFSSDSSSSDDYQRQRLTTKESK